MKIIDLLNKIANGEEVPKIIKYKGDEFYLDDLNHYIIYYKYAELYGDLLDKCGDDSLGVFLNYEVEIIEEDKKIEKCENYCCYSDFINDNDKEKFYKELQNSMFKLTDKINEIIDYLNKGDK